MAEIRFQRNRPWDFGIKPSEYLKSGPIDDNLTRAVEEIGIDEIDGIFALTVSIPDLRVLSPEEHHVLDDICLFDYNPSVLVASNAKPAGDFHLSDLDRAKKTLQELGLYVDDSAISLGMDAPLVFTVSSNPEILEVLRKGFSDWCQGIRSDRGYHLTSGLCYGYPVADSLGFDGFNLSKFVNRKRTIGYDGRLDVLEHVVCVTRWTQYWRKNVGIRGEEHLANVYREVLGK